MPFVVREQLGEASGRRFVKTGEPVVRDSNVAT